MDPYRFPDEQADELIATMVERLEARVGDARFAGFIDDYMDAIEWPASGLVLEMGCGSGGVTRRMAERAGKNVRVIGADISEKFLKHARRLSEPEAIEWLKCDEECVPLDAETVDVLVMHTLLSHVGDPGALLREACRLLKPEGKLIVFDADFAATSYGYPDFEKGLAIDRALVGSIASQVDICRQLPRYLIGAGLRTIDHRAYLISEVGRGDFWLSSVKAWERMLPSMDALSPKDGKEWVDTMLKSHEDGSFFASGTYYTFFAEKTPR